MEPRKRIPLHNHADLNSGGRLASSSVGVPNVVPATPAAPAAGEPVADAHVADTSDAHDASAISIVDAGTYFTGTDVEAALQELGAGGGGGGSVATDAIWDAAGDLAVGTGANTAAKLAVGANGHVLTSNGTTATWAAPTAGGSSRFYLDQATLHGTYGDDFVDNALDAKWTLVNLTAGGVIGGCDDGSHARWQVGAVSTDAQNIYETGPNADEFTVIASGHVWQYGGDIMVGPYIVSSTGTGVGGHIRGGGNDIGLTNLTSYAYASFAAQRTTISTNAASLAALGQRMWWRLRKSLGVYLFDISLNGVAWGPALSAVPSSFTPAKVGFGLIYHLNGMADIHLDRFNVVDVLSYGNNLIITPSSGTATYSAVSEYSGSFTAAKAADANLGTDWASSGTPATSWWLCTWSVGQTLNRVRVRNRAASVIGGAYVELSDGSTTTRVPLGYVDNTSSVAWYLADFPTLTGITTVKVVGIATSGIGVSGYVEVEAYLAS